MSLDDAMTKAYGGLYSTVDVVQNKINPIVADLAQFKPTINYVDPFQPQMADIARIIKFTNSPDAPDNVRNNAKIICTQFGGWDAHSGIINSYFYKIRVLGSALKGLIHYLNQWGLLSTTVIQVITEFGRTTRRNVGLGLDHGAGNRIMILGGPVARGVFGPEASVQEANSQNHFTPQVAFTGIQKQILKGCGFSADSLEQVFKVKLPGETQLPFLI